jgi:HSP20 family protein
MQTLRNDPWALINGFGQTLDRLVLNKRVPTAQGRHAWAPAADIREYDDRFEILADVPGVTAEDLEITLDDGILTLEGERELGSVDTADGIRRAERAHGKFQRQFRLPELAAATGLTAVQASGVVTVTVPKLSRPEPYRFEVKSH